MKERRGTALVNKMNGGRREVPELDGVVAGMWSSHPDPSG